MEDNSISEQNLHQKRSFAYYIYKVSLACCLMFLLFIGKNLQPTILSNLFAIISITLLVIGFAIRARSVVAKIWKTAVGKLLLALCGALTAVIAAVPARLIVSGAMHLPANDFPITLALWTILCYPVISIILAAAILFVIYVTLLCTAGLIGLSTQPPLDGLIVGVAQLLPSEWALNESILGSRGRLTIMMFADAIAAAVLSVIVAYSLTGWAKTVDRPNIVRIFSYWADFETPTAYPGIEKGRARLLESGIVAYARLEKWDVNIRVACLKGLTCPQPQMAVSASHQ